MLYQSLDRIDAMWRPFSKNSTKTPINYLYFSIFLIALGCFTLTHLFFWEKPIIGVYLLFLVYALGQIFFEISFLILIASFLHHFAPRWLFRCFIIFCFFLFLLHFTDFTMIRLMDTTVSYAFSFLFGAGIQYSFSALKAVSMNKSMLLFMGTITLLIPLLGTALYSITSKISSQKPWTPPFQHIVKAFFASCIFLFLLDASLKPFLTRKAHRMWVKKLPLKTTFFEPPQKTLTLPAPLKPPIEENKVEALLPTFPLKKRPNLYVFVIETLRKDYLTEEIAPYLNRFGKHHHDFPDSFANANWTLLSWFALFHAKAPYHWTHVKHHFSQGAIPLRILKKWGYQNHVIASSDLSYFGLDKMIFGENRELIDHLEAFSSRWDLKTHEKDALCIQTFQKTLENPAYCEGQAFFFFLDSPHSEYSFPEDQAKFLPTLETIPYLTLTPKDLEPLKNRYRNAVAYVDSLLETFEKTLKEKGLYEEAIIAITGDHGEEFFEEGSIFHGTHLNREQTFVPCLIKASHMQNFSPQITHIDLFPSLLHAIAKEPLEKALFEGMSVFEPKEKIPYRICVHQNGPNTPCEFSLEKRDKKLLLRLLDPKKIYEPGQVEILSMSPYPLEEKGWEEHVERFFSKALFPLIEVSLPSKEDL